MSELPSNTTHAPTAADSAPGNDALSHLYKMSTTSAAGQEYVAINGASIAALLLGIASVLVLVQWVLLIIPLAGIVCALIAWVQIRGSNGTQTGRAFAGIGFLLALLLGGARAGMAARDWAQDRSDTRTCAPIIEELSRDAHSGRFDEAYEDLFTAAFRRRVDRKAFQDAFQQYADRADYGPISSIEWNRNPMEFGDVGSSGVRIGYAMCVFKFLRYPYPFRQAITFSTRDGPWRIDNIDILWPPTKAEAGGKQQ